MVQASGAPAPAVFSGHGGSVPKRGNMSLFERLNEEKGLQLPVFGTPVLSAPRLHSSTFFVTFISENGGSMYPCVLCYLTSVYLHSIAASWYLVGLLLAHISF